MEGFSCGIDIPPVSLPNGHGVSAKSRHHHCVLLDTHRSPRRILQEHAFSNRYTALKSLSTTLASPERDYEMELAFGIAHCAMESISGDTTLVRISPECIRGHKLNRNAQWHRITGLQSLFRDLRGSLAAAWFCPPRYHDGCRRNRKPLLVAGEYWAFLLVAYDEARVRSMVPKKATDIPFHSRKIDEARVLRVVIAPKTRGIGGVPQRFKAQDWPLSEIVHARRAMKQKTLNTA